MTDITNAQLAAQISELVAYWRTRDLEFQGWLAGSATGGPYSDGRYPLTDYLETTYYVKSPAALQQSVTGMVNSASSYATAAAASQAAAATSKTGADTARDVAVAARDAAVAARDAASTSQSTAATLAANAQTYATSAYNSAATATSAAATATQKAADADADRIAAQAAAAAAQASATSAATFDPNLFYSKTASDSRYRQLSVAVPWADLSGVPSTFTPSAHSHVISDVTNLQTSLDAKAPLASPALSGTPTAPTATVGTNTTQIATTAFVRGEVSALVAAAPGTLDTLNELASALGNDPNFATTVTNSLAGKAPLTGTGASGTWNISVTGSAGSVAWTNVSGRPTTLSSFTNDSGFITGITSGMVTGALGYTPYNSSNPSGYITSSALSSYLPLSGGTLTGALTWAAAGGLGNGNARSLVTGYSGGNYGQTGYGISYTTTSGLHNYAINDIVSLWEAYDGIRVYAAPGGTVGTAITWTTVLDARRNNSSMLFKGQSVLDAANYNSYSPTLTGTGASGTWGINITGNAATATSATDSTKLPLNGGTLTGSLTVGSDGGGANYVQRAINGWGDVVQVWRGGSNVWNLQDSSGSAKVTSSSFYVGSNLALHAGNYNSYAPTLTGTGASGTWGISITGNAATVGSRSPGTSAGNLAYFDSSSAYLQTPSWIGLGGDKGIYAPSGMNGAHFYVNTDATYGTWRMLGSRNGYTGINMSCGNGDITFMAATNSNISGVHNQSYGWHYFWENGVFYIGRNAYGGNQSAALHAANYSSYALPLSGGTLTGALSVSSAFGTISAVRGSYYGYSAGYGALIIGATSGNVTPCINVDPISNASGVFSGNGNEVMFRNGVRFISPNSSNNSYHFYATLQDGVSNFTSTLQQSGNQVLHAGNYTGYSPSLTGSGASGTWSISTTDDFLHSDRDFPSGTLITTDINYAVTYGDPFVLEIRGNSYGNLTPLDIQYQGYIYADTIINHGGYSNGLNISGLVAINNGGNLCFWFPSQGYWNGYNVKVYVPYGGRQRNRVTSITGAAKPTTAKEVGLSANIRQSLHSGNFTSYAPSLTGSGASGTWNISLSSATNSALWRPNAQTFGAWEISGSKNGYSGIACNGTSHIINWMVDLGGNLQGWYNQSYGWQMYWSSGTLSVFKNAYGGGTQAIVLDSVNYSSYALPLSGGTMTGDLVLSTGSNKTIQLGSASNYYWRLRAVGDDFRIIAGADTATAMAFQYSTWNVGIGTTSPSYKLHVSGDIYATSNVIAYSDERVKTNWRNLDDRFLVKLSGVKSGIYDRTDIELTQAGVSAQALREVLPETVMESADGELSVAYGNAALVASIELAKEVVALRHEVEQLKQQLH